MTHFATADEPNKGIQTQWLAFSGLVKKYPELAMSTANSAALMTYPETYGQWVRPGVVLYGGSPFAHITAASMGLLPGMSLNSEVIAIQEVHQGDAVGYGATYMATQDMRLAVVACGYADGYPRHAPSGTPVWVAGKICPLVGRVSMDMLAVSVGADVEVGSPVQLWGNQLSIDEVATKAGTIGYELMCALTRRVPLRYLVE
jgi:alanine racemase